MGRLKKKMESQILQIQNKALTVKARVPHNIELDDKARNQFYSHWYYSGARLLTSIDDYSSAQTISQKLNLPQKTVHEVVEFLIQYGLCIEKNGLLKMGPKATHLEAHSPLVTRHHTNWRLKGIENMENLGPEELFYTGPMALSVSSMKKIRAVLVSSIEEITNEAVDSKSETLACLNVDWFQVKR